MASVPVLMRRIRRSRPETQGSKRRSRYEAYADEYERIFSAVDDCTGEDSLDELGEWAIDWTKREGQLPEPSRVREKAREVCENRGVELSEGSPLRG